MLKGYVDEHNMTVFICPDCGFEKRFDASAFKNKKKILQLNAGVEIKLKWRLSLENISEKR